MWLFSVIIIFSIAIPFSLSFEHHLNFYKRWKVIIPSILIVSILIVSLNIFFTHMKVWGFNPNYNMNIMIFDLPIEEWLYIFFVPYSSMFIHDAIRCCWPKLRLRRKFSKVVCLVLLLILIPIILSNLDKIYTICVLALLMLSLVWAMFYHRNIIGRFFVTYLVMLLPFIIINGILTGTYISKEIIWYKESATLGLHVLTIPIEDFGYLFSYVLFTLLVRQTLIEHNFLASKNLDEETDDQDIKSYSLNHIIH